MLYSYYSTNLCFVMSSYISIPLTCVFSYMYKGLDLKPWKNIIKVCESVNKVPKQWKITKKTNNMICTTLIKWLPKFVKSCFFVFCRKCEQASQTIKNHKKTEKKHDITNLGSHLIKVMQIMFVCFFCDFSWFGNLVHTFAHFYCVFHGFRSNPL